MGSFNTFPFNEGQFNGDGGDGGSEYLGEIYNPGSGPYNYPQITISTPLQPPPLQLTNVATLLQANLAGLLLFLNGILLTEGLDYSRNGASITMLLQAPSKDDRFTARVFVLGKQLGGSGKDRYVAPWTLKVTGPFDGAGMNYMVSLGPTIMPTSNPTLFTWGVTLRRSQIYRNGMIQTVGVDVASAPTSMVFLNGIVPDPSDILTVIGYS